MQPCTAPLRVAIVGTLWHPAVLSVLLTHQVRPWRFSRCTARPASIDRAVCVAGLLALGNDQSNCVELFSQNVSRRGLDSVIGIHGCLDWQHFLRDVLRRAAEFIDIVHHDDRLPTAHDARRPLHAFASLGLASMAGEYGVCSLWRPRQRTSLPRVPPRPERGKREDKHHARPQFKL